jgi:hypothetical protein
MTYTNKLAELILEEIGFFSNCTKFVRGAHDEIFAAYGEDTSDFDGIELVDYYAYVNGRFNVFLNSSLNNKEKKSFSEYFTESDLFKINVETKSRDDLQMRFKFKIKSTKRNVFYNLFVNIKFFSFDGEEYLIDSEFQETVSDEEIGQIIAMKIITK